MSIDPKLATEILTSPTAEKIYADILSSPAKEASKILTDVVKTVRLVLSPLQFTATLQDALEKKISNFCQTIPQDKIQPPPLPLLGAVIEGTKYREDGDEISTLYFSLLEKAMNKDLSYMVHPAFPRLIEQLCPDEVLILHTLSELGEQIVVKQSSSKTKIEGQDFRPHFSTLSMRILTINLAYPENCEVYIDHLCDLSLIVSHNQLETITPYALIGGGLKRAKEREENLIIQRKIEFTKFGKMFIDACEKISEV